MFVALTVYLTEIDRKTVSVRLQHCGKAESATRHECNLSDLLRSSRMWHETYLNENLRDRQSEHLRTKLQKIGTDLARLLFPNGNTFVTHAKTLIFVAPPSLQAVPFELVNLNGSFLAESVPIVRSVAAEHIITREREKTFGTNITLINSRDVENLRPGIESEINRSLNLLPKSKSEIYRAENLRLDDLLARLSQARVFYYVGHSHAGALPLWRKDRLTAEVLQGQNFSNLEVVFVNGCDSALGAGAKKEGLPAAFALAGARYYLGYSVPITNEIAATIGENFWRLVPKFGIPEAAYRARLKARDDFGNGDFGWLGLRCYGPENLRKTKSNAKLKFSLVALTIVACFASVVPYLKRIRVQPLPQERSQIQRPVAKKPQRKASFEKSNKIATVPAPGAEPMQLTKPQKTTKEDKRPEALAADQLWSSIQESEMQNFATLVRRGQYVPPRETNCYLEAQGFTLSWREFVDLRRFAKTHEHEDAPVRIQVNLADGKGDRISRIGGLNHAGQVKRSARMVQGAWQRLVEHRCLNKTVD